MRTERCSSWPPATLSTPRRSLAFPAAKMPREPSPKHLASHSCSSWQGWGPVSWLAQEGARKSAAQGSRLLPGVSCVTVDKQPDLSEPHSQSQHPLASNCHPNDTCPYRSHYGPYQELAHPRSTPGGPGASQVVMRLGHQEKWKWCGGQQPAGHGRPPDASASE